MKTALFGGTFDPIHNGHLSVIKMVFTHTSYNRIICIPTAIPPHKHYVAHVSDTDRLTMLSLAIEECRQQWSFLEGKELLVDACEMNRGGVSYMFDTVQHISTSYSFEGKLGLIIGDDLLSGLSSWHRFEELMRVVEILVCKRENCQIPIPPELTQYPITLLANEIYEESSTHIRHQLGTENQQLSTRVPKKVLQYIQEHGLYRNLSYS